MFDTFISNSGGAISRYNDLIKVLAPRSELTGTAILQMARYEDVFLDSQFENGSDGTLYEYELVYYPTTATAAGLKLPSPDLVVNVNRILDNGNSIEDYRWNFLNKINREAENFTPIMNYCKLFSLSGTAFETGVDSVIDVDSWLRGMAYAVLTGAGDNAAAGSFHNGIYYARPDGRIIFFPHDMDYSFDATRSIYANLECAALTANAARRRLYLGHLHDIISTTYNNSYMSSWASHFAALDPAQNWSAELSFINSRSSYVSSQINSQIPSVAFAITTPSPLTTGGLTATLAGTGWVNVRNIRLAGTTTPLAVTWTGTNTWQTTIAATPGLNTVTLEALNFSGVVIGTASVQVNATTIVEPASSSNLVISEIMYHPADPSQAEINAGFVDPEAFEYIELTNIGANTLNLTGVRFVGNLEYDFTSETTLAPGARTLIARDRAAFSARYPSAVSFLAAGAFQNGTGLNNAGELIQLTAANGQFIRNFSYSDAFPWPVAADGTGYSLVLIAPGQNPDHGLPSNWRASIIPGGNPASGDSQPFVGITTADADFDGVPALVEYALGTSDTNRSSSGIVSSRGLDGHITVTLTRNLAADDAVCVLESSENLSQWNEGFTILSETPTGDGTVIIMARSNEPMNGNFFLRLKASLR
ncbi:MAG: lamin tail domain-containing protein [Akkermansiaceae bacterium]|nr:lamin tail domain-containing protein [Akkermansiaceae bacterium]